MTHNSDVSPIRQPSNEERISNLIKENRNLRDELNYLRAEKEMLYNKLLTMKNYITDAYDEIGKEHFNDRFYED